MFLFTFFKTTYLNEKYIKFTRFLLKIKMDVDIYKTCCGCLCKDKKTLPISDYLKTAYFSKLLSEAEISLKRSNTLRLCWQCHAYVRKCIQFKQQVQHSLLVLNNVQFESAHRPQTKSLGIKKVVELSLLPDSQSEDTFRVLNPNLQNDIPHLKVFDLALVSDNQSEETIIVLNSNQIKEEVPNSNLIKDELDENHYSDSDNTLLINFSKKKKSKKSFFKKKLFEEVLMNDEEVLQERRLLEQSDEFVNAMFKCMKCLISFANEDDLKEHSEKKHELHTKYKCVICECCFSSEVSYNYHRRRHAKRYVCTACPVKSASVRAAAKHYEMTHCHSETYKVESDEEKNSNGNQKTNEMISEDIFPCLECNKTFRWKTSLRKHMETHRIEAGEKRKPFCEPCGLSFTTTCNLQKHVKNSSKHQIQLKLRKLKDSELSPEALSAEVGDIKTKVYSSKEVYSCPHCGKKFQWRGNMMRHVQTHTLRAKGELVCKPCNRTFSSLATYKQHMQVSRKHVSEDDFKYMCSDCGKRFATKTRLKEHVDWEHLKNYVHTCTDCQKVFRSHTSLYVHRQVIHKKIKPEHLCDHCGKSFPNKSKLLNHVTALHSGSAPYACSRCPARFSWHSCLSRHVRRLHRDVRRD